MKLKTVSTNKMLQTVEDYEAILNEIEGIITESEVKITYFLNELDLKRTTFYHKRKNLDFSTDEVRKMIKIWEKFGKD